ncbi:aspartate-semialdehyde dehydrogenase [Atopomonas sediminilitoris]|uniref:aspartate-semialdehyde dehydrogenase n=1 Tax=Atopomonas sediminilitoris TaxID=2919919 RepID=UPI001F4DE80D|nr:aspartate-semialdehyde dehydrogenase [Atopomonas sediminilitoris]MCJ8170885.1 aspartate-semialdehyde dehydrogenase [Atopomonas sediminilitoris]
MLPPIPQSILPHGVHLDPAKPKPDIPPVAPAQESSKSEGVKLKDRPDPDDAQGYRRQGKAADEADDETDAEADQEAQLLADPLERHDMSRKGLWVDVEV